MMFWRSRERSVPRKKGNVTPETFPDSEKSLNTDRSTSDSQMQSLKEGLKIYLSEGNEFDLNMSSKSNITNATEFSVKTAVFNDGTQPSTTDTDLEDLFEEKCHLEIPEGITRQPFQPLPAMFEAAKTIPSHLRSMNYYQRKVAKFQPRITNLISPLTAIGSNNQGDSNPSPVTQGGSVPPNLFSTLFGGNNVIVCPASPKSSVQQSPQKTVQIRSGISWADSLSPSTKAGVLNYYQNRFELLQNKSPNSGIMLKQTQRRSYAFRQEGCDEDAKFPSSNIPISAGDEEIKLTMQYFHSPRTPFGSPFRNTTGQGREISEMASGSSSILGPSMNITSTSIVTVATSQPCIAYTPAASISSFDSDFEV